MAGLGKQICRPVKLWHISPGGTLLRVELFPQRRYAEALNPMPVNVALFGNKAFVDVNKLR